MTLATSEDANESASPAAASLTSGDRSQATTATSSASFGNELALTNRMEGAAATSTAASGTDPLATSGDDQALATSDALFVTPASAFNKATAGESSSATSDLLGADEQAMSDWFWNFSSFVSFAPVTSQEDPLTTMATVSDQASPFVSLLASNEPATTMTTLLTDSAEASASESTTSATRQGTLKVESEAVSDAASAAPAQGNDNSQSPVSSQAAAASAGQQNTAATRPTTTTSRPSWRPSWSSAVRWWARRTGWQAAVSTTNRWPAAPTVTVPAPGRRPSSQPLAAKQQPKPARGNAKLGPGPKAGRRQGGCPPGPTVGDPADPASGRRQAGSHGQGRGFT